MYCTSMSLSSSCLHVRSLAPLSLVCICVLAQNLFCLLLSNGKHSLVFKLRRKLEGVTEKQTSEKNLLHLLGSLKIVNRGNEWQLTLHPEVFEYCLPLDLIGFHTGKRGKRKSWEKHLLAFL